MTEREWVSARGIDHSASERWDVRWLDDDIGKRRTLLPGGWSAKVEELVDGGSETWGSYRPRPGRSKPRQLLLPFRGGEMEEPIETMGNVARTPEGNRFILNTMLDMSNGEYFDPLDCSDFCFDMRQSPEDTDLLLFGIVARE